MEKDNNKDNNKELAEELPVEPNKELAEELPVELNKEIAEELNKEIAEELNKKVTKKLDKEVTKKLDKENIIIKMTDVTKIYPNGVKALNVINIDISKGEFVFIVGPTGTGKSTFLKLINREETVTEGEVIVDGRDVEKLSVNEVPYLRRRLGVIFQDFKLLPRKTCYENVAYALQVIGAGQREISYKVPRALEAVGLENKGTRYPDELSGGEKQRVAIARAFVNNPVIILADEPTGNLDPDTSWEITQLLINLNSRGTTVLMATHDKSIVNRTRKRVVVLHTDGTIFSDQEKGGYIHGL